MNKRNKRSYKYIPIQLEQIEGFVFIKMLGKPRPTTIFPVTFGTNNIHRYNMKMRQPQILRYRTIHLL